MAGPAHRSRASSSICSTTIVCSVRRATDLAPGVCDPAEHILAVGDLRVHRAGSRKRRPVPRSTRYAASFVVPRSTASPSAARSAPARRPPHRARRCTAARVCQPKRRRVSGSSRSHASGTVASSGSSPSRSRDGVGAKIIERRRGELEIARDDRWVELERTVLALELQALCGGQRLRRGYRSARRRWRASGRRAASRPASSASVSSRALGDAGRRDLAADHAHAAAAARPVAAARRGELDAAASAPPPAASRRGRTRRGGRPARTRS